MSEMLFTFISGWGWNKITMFQRIESVYKRIHFILLWVGLSIYIFVSGLRLTQSTPTWWTMLGGNIVWPLILVFGPGGPEFKLRTPDQQVFVVWVVLECFFYHGFQRTSKLAYSPFGSIYKLLRLAKDTPAFSRVPSLVQLRHSFLVEAHVKCLG